MKTQLRQKVKAIDSYGAKFQELDGEHWLNLKNGVEKHKGTRGNKTQPMLSGCQTVGVNEACKIGDKAPTPSTNAIAMADLGGKIKYVDTSFLTLWRCDNEQEVLGKSIVEFLEMPETAAEIMKAVSQESVWVGDLIGKRKDSSLFDVHLSVNPVKGADGQPAIIIASFVDVTERKQIEAELKAQISLTDRILAVVPNAALVLDGNLKVILASKAFYDTFGTIERHVIGEPIYNIIPVVELSKKISKVLQGKESAGELEFRHRLGTLDRILVSSVIPVRRGELLLFLRDVTDERERQERLYLTDRLASIGEMMSGVAHELNNPLTSIIGLSEVLMEEDMSSEAREDAEAIYSQAQRTAGIIRKLLTFARKHPPVKQLTQINGIVQDVLSLRSYVHRVNNIQVNTYLDASLPETMADYFQMQQVFLNIILNAETAMVDTHGKGTLTITTRRLNNTISITFTDDGSGISKENLPRIFDPFFTTKEVGKGTGLGLSICYGIVTAHGGKIYAKSKLGVGATFVVDLPIRIR